ncbi:hypothetical protein [Asticcacaulis sp. W401b]|uniref:hypothetical protein n=1 Tax=Asticcacaulis sp. W401b TaxID=3388666 RepID=UPI003970E1E3
MAHTTEIAAAIEKRNDTFARLKVGEDIDPAYSATVGAFRRAMAANTERERVYAMRAGEDQFHRRNSVIVQNGLIWAKNLRAESRGYLMEENVAQVCQSDRSNTEWLWIGVHPGTSSSCFNRLICNGKLWNARVLTGADRNPGIPNVSSKSNNN